LLLRIRSAHLGIFGFLKEFAHQYSDIFALFNYVVKAGLSGGYHTPRRELGVTMHFSEIIELKFGKKLPYILCILTLFKNYGCLVISEKCVATRIFLFGFR